MDDGEGTFVGCVWFVKEGASCSFEGSWKKACCEDQGDEHVEGFKPSGMKAGQDVEGKAVVSGFCWDVFGDGKEVRETC